ncbi:hypothetical protein [Sorangium sp. So ce542]|uniref:hypothetical protein n=1 Tax=Sorangium sp. So ce542 TaxID=3133316 RepID=UPI003F61F3D1
MSTDTLRHPPDPPRSELKEPGMQQEERPQRRKRRKETERKGTEMELYSSLPLAPLRPSSHESDFRRIST